MNNNQPEQKILTDKAATGAGTAACAAGYRHFVLQLSAAINTTATVKFAASASRNCPDFSAAQSASNHWDYVGAYDLQSGLFISGDTGVSLDNDSVANNTRQYVVNAECIRWVSAIVTSLTDGSVTVVGIAADNL